MAAAAVAAVSRQWAAKLRMSGGTIRMQRRRTLGTVDTQETAKFARMAAQWWALDGPVAPLHRLNPMRVAYLLQRLDAVRRTHAVPSARRAQDARDGDAPRRADAVRRTNAPLAGVSVLDVGCGGGLLAECLARLGADVLGIDATAESIAIAQQHAAMDPALGERLLYRHTNTAEMLASKARFDVVTALEVVEHVSDADVFIRECGALVKPGGSLFVSTLNKTLKALVLGIVVAEHVLRWAAPGTHSWTKFQSPDALTVALTGAGLAVEHVAGIQYHVCSRTWKLGDDTDINYIMHATKPL